MTLTRNGLVWKVLKWYGYPDWRLEAGISLCKTFWSILLGMVVLLPLRAYQWVLNLASGWMDELSGTLFTVAAWAVTASLAVAWALTLFIPWGRAWAWVATVWVVMLGMALILGVIYLIQKGAVKVSQSEFIEVVSGFAGAVRNRVCPTIRFSESEWARFDRENARGSDRHPD